MTCAPGQAQVKAHCRKGGKGLGSKRKSKPTASSGDRKRGPSSTKVRKPRGPRKPKPAPEPIAERKIAKMRKPKVQ